MPAVGFAFNIHKKYTLTHSLARWYDEVEKNPANTEIHTCTHTIIMFVMPLFLALFSTVLLW